MLDCRRLLVLLALLFLASCGEDESDAESPLQQGSGGGIVVDSTGALEAVEGVGLMRARRALSRDRASSSSRASWRESRLPTSL